LNYSIFYPFSVNIHGKVRPDPYHKPALLQEYFAELMLRKNLADYV
jgi:hypothetical protein